MTLPTGPARWRMKVWPWSLCTALIMSGYPSVGRCHLA